MRIEVIAECAIANGSVQQAITLTRALARLAITVRLASVTDIILPSVAATLRNLDIELVTYLPDCSRWADLHIVVGLWEKGTADVAIELVRQGTRVILAPALYWCDPLSRLMREFRGCAEALWYVSWDQAVETRLLWSLAERIEVVRCAVDCERFRPVDRNATGKPWVLGRHSRDASEKFSALHSPLLSHLIESHDVVLRMLGAQTVVGEQPQRGLEVLAEDAIHPAQFLAGLDLWVYSHAPRWQETACIAMIEAMACGLPVLVNNAGGMREYLEHGRTGFACSDSDEYMRYVRLLLEHPRLRLAMSRNARELAVRSYSIEALSAQLKTVLHL